MLRLWLALACFALGLLVLGISVFSTRPMVALLAAMLLFAPTVLSPDEAVQNPPEELDAADRAAAAWLDSDSWDVEQLERSVDRALRGLSIGAAYPMDVDTSRPGGYACPITHQELLSHICDI